MRSRRNCANSCDFKELEKYDDVINNFQHVHDASEMKSRTTQVANRHKFKMFSLIKQKCKMISNFVLCPHAYAKNLKHETATAEE